MLVILGRDDEMVASLQTKAPYVRFRAPKKEKAQKDSLEAKEAT